MANMAGFRLPIHSVPLQALVSEPVKPIIDCVVMSGAVHAYVSQSDKGELVIGAGAPTSTSATASAALSTSPRRPSPRSASSFPSSSRMRMLRQWGGIVDTCPGRQPDHLQDPGRESSYINCGWGTGGFKATPGSGWVFAHTHGP